MSSRPRTSPRGLGSLFLKHFWRQREPDQSFPRTLGGVRRTNLDNIRQGDTIVLVLGQTGSGKSLFITKTVGCDVGVRHGYEAETKSITPIRVVLAKGPQYKGDLILVDTPGIELGEGSEEHDMILSWCKQARHRGLAIFGVLYFTKLQDLIWDIPVGALSVLIGASKEHKVPDDVVFVLSMEERTTTQPITKVARVKRSGIARKEDEGKGGEVAKEAVNGPEATTKGQGEESKEAANEPKEAANEPGEATKEPGVAAKEPGEEVEQPGEDAKEPEATIQKWHNKKGNFKRAQFSGATKSAFEIMQSITPFTPDRRGVRPKDIVIAVMGPTGSGKSTFISTIANNSAEIGHNLQSCTNSVNLIRAPGHTPFEGERVFVDTPGFDDTHLSDVDILKMIADWLNESYGDGVRLSGLLYFHRISDNRMAGTPLKNLRMFQELCGRDMFQSIILVTTMWDDVDEDTGTSRETELITNYWGGMISLGSRTARFYRTEASALDVIDPVVEASMDDSRALAKDTILLLQREMYLLRQQLPETSAGQQLISKLELLLSRRRDLLARISGDVAECRAEGDEDSVEILMQELEKLQQQMASTMQEMDRMALPQKNLSRMHRLLHRINPIRG